MDKKLLSCPHCGGEVEELRRLNRYKAYWDELYGQGLEVANWHQNGQAEPLGSFLDDAESELGPDKHLYPVPAVEWVPVSERPPKPHVTVLAFMSGWGWTSPAVQEAWYRGDGTWCSNHSGGPIVVTHWAEMPKPPDEG